VSSSIYLHVAHLFLTKIFADIGIIAKSSDFGGHFEFEAYDILKSVTNKFVKSYSIILTNFRNIFTV